MITKKIQKEIDEYIITEEEAISLGMGKLTTPYKSTELEMLIAVIQDMRRSSISYGLVKASEGIEVWRSGMKMIDEE